MRLENIECRLEGC